MFKTNWSYIVTALVAAALVAVIGDPAAVWFTPVGTFLFVAMIGGAIHCCTAPFLPPEDSAEEIRPSVMVREVIKEGVREALEQRLMQEAMAYNTAHGCALTVKEVKAAQQRLRLMTEAELTEAEEEMASLMVTT